MTTTQEKIELLLKCIPGDSDSPFKKALKKEIQKLASDSYIQGSHDCHDAMVHAGKIKK